MRLAFDSQILLPNLDFKDDLERNPMNKNYKIVYSLRMNNQKSKKRVITKISKSSTKTTNMAMEWQNHCLLVVLKIAMIFLG